MVRSLILPGVAACEAAASVLFKPSVTTVAVGSFQLRGASWLCPACAAVQDVDAWCTLVLYGQTRSKYLTRVIGAALPLPLTMGSRFPS